MRKKSLLFIIPLLFLLPSCWWYSFTGASIDPEIKTYSVGYFTNNAPLVQPTLSQSFTDALKEKIAAQTDLIMVNNNGDVHFEGEITGYSTQAVAIQGDDRAALNRLTITIKVRYYNKNNEDDNFESSFSRYQDYESSISLSAVEGNLIEEINEQLVEDIFNKAFVNW